MNRRQFIKSIAAIPFVGLVAKAENIPVKRHFSKVTCDKCGRRNWSEVLPFRCDQCGAELHMWRKWERIPGGCPTPILD